MPTRLIAIDWGTSSFRARRVDAEGHVLDLRRTDDGILTVKDGGFEQTLRAAIGGWLDPAVPCLASGMITSRQGWIETPYVDCPASHADIVERVVTHTLHDGVRLAFVPGLRLPGGMRDVMRGEETQILGVMEEGLAVHPGTHAKWAVVERGAIIDFATFMTGELFAVLMEHSILGRLAHGREHDDDAFARGVETGARAAEAGSLSHDLFSARALALAGELRLEGVASYLSALLIGFEIVSAPRVIACGARVPEVFGGADHVRRYLAAFARLGRPAKAGPENATATGLIAIARLLKWL